MIRCWLCLFAEAKRAARFRAARGRYQIPGWRSTIGSVVRTSPDLHQNCEVVARRRLQRRELLVGLELLQPQQLADGQHVPVVQISGARAARAPPIAKAGLLICPDGIFEGSRMMLSIWVQ